MPGNAVRPFVNIDRNACAAGTFVTHASADRHIIDAATRHRWRLKARCADSESQFLAMKKFFVFTAIASRRRSPEPAFRANRPDRFGSREFVRATMKRCSRRTIDASSRADRDDDDGENVARRATLRCRVWI
jgi:hypothetical protein